jgi:Transglycosylase-like domain
MLFRYRSLLEKPSRLTIAIAVTGIGVAAAASAVAVTLPGGATAGAATATAYLHGAGVAPAEATPHPAVQLQAKEIETARLARQHAAVKAMRAHEARLAARAAARRAAGAAGRRAARRAAHRAAVLAAQRQARNARQAPSTSPGPAQPSGAGLSGVWACIAQHESGGNSASNTGNGFYGAFQFTLASWQAVGGPPGLPSDYPLSVQLHYAEVLQARSGWGNWPVTSQMCGV